MKVCAHINYGPFTNGHSRFDSSKQAVRNFRNLLQELGIDKGDGDHYTVDLFPQCSECNSMMNFHDYPMARYQLGPRGGLRRVIV